MNKIIWIASYPKSGNTWIRYLLGNYFFNQNNNLNADIISNLKKFHFDDKLFNSSSLEGLKENPYDVSKYWIKSQENLKITNGNVVFLKTHNALVNINNNEFTNDNLSLAIIHIVRDPRDVLISYSKYRNKSLDETIKFMVSKNLSYVRKKNDPTEIEIIGSWAFHYNSWKNGIKKIPRIVIKYEDLINDSYKVFFKVIKFLSKLMNLEINDKKIKSSINLSQFENLKKFEELNLFLENQGKENFFRSGKYNNWIKELSYEQVKMIEDNFKAEMIDLGYLKKYKY